MYVLVCPIGCWAQPVGPCVAQNNVRYDQTPGGCSVLNMYEST